MTSKHVKNYKDFYEDDSMPVGIGDHLFRMEKSLDHEKGLIGRGIKYDGMIFQFSSPQVLTFHTKGCIIPMDIVFILNDKIVQINHSCHPGIPLIKCGKADTVLEFPAGTCKKLEIETGTFCKI